MIRALLLNAYKCLGWRLIVLFLFLLLSGVFEGMGLTMLFPLLAKFGIGETADASGLLSQIASILDFLHVPNEFTVLLLITVGLMYIQVVFTFAKGWMESECQTRYAKYWQSNLFSSFIEAGWAFFGGERAANRVNAIMVDASRIAAAFYIAVQIVTSGLFILVYAAISFISSWKMVMLLTVFGMAIFLAVRPLSRKSKRIGEKVTEVSENMQHRTTEFMQNAKLIKATATEPMAKRLFGDAAEDFRRVYLTAGIMPKLIVAIYMICGYTILGAGLWIAVVHFKINPAAVVVAMYVFLRLYMQLTNFQQFRQAFLLSAPALAAASRQLEHARSLVELLGEGRTLPAGPAGVKFKDVTFRYDQSPALDEVSLDVPPGEMIGITGPSGAGKSTLVDLMVGLVKKERGTVEIDGMPIEAISLRDWRRSIGYVGQDTLLLNGTVAENLTWGNEVARSSVEEAAKTANAHDFIMDLPHGYDTEIGDRGARLSGGQRQRLGLARALVGGKRLLILDEATSALDAESEHQILKALERLRGKVTILMVAHRLATLSPSDTILLFDKGRIVESGSWTELTERKGLFDRLRQLQSTSL
jgi:ATP-binding cassette, subfamily C, bacterial